MVKISVDYLGELRCRATHGPSGVTFQTDAPVDNQGKGESFSPTDLVATALGTCLATIMGIAAVRYEVDLKGMHIEVEKEMASSPSRRIKRLTAVVDIPLPESHPKRELLEQAAMQCPVHASLHPDVEQKITFRWRSE